MMDVENGTSEQRRNTEEEEEEAEGRGKIVAKIESVESRGELITTTQANKSKLGLIKTARHCCLLICQSLPLFLGRSCGSHSRYRSISRRPERRAEWKLREQKRT